MILAVVIVSLLIVALLHGNASENLQSRFRDYAGYVLLGDPNNTSWMIANRSDDYIDMSNYTLYQQFYASDHAEYFSNLVNLFDKFIASYNTSKKAMDANVSDSIDQYIQIFNLLNALSKTPKINNNVLQKLFMEPGKTGALTWLDENFSALKNTPDGGEYFDTAYAYAELYLGILENYQQMGCLKANDIDDACVEKYAPSEAQTLALQNISNLQNDLVLIEAYLIDRLQQGCWEVWNLIGDNNA